MNASTTTSTNSAGGQSSDSDGGSGEGPSPSRRAAPSAESSSAAGDADNPPEPANPSNRLRIDLSVDSAHDRTIDADWLRDHTHRAAMHMRELVPEAAFTDISVIVVGDERMTRLHREHCNLDSTTDVLTFVLSSPDEPIDIEIAICADEAARRAAERHHSIERELLLYIVHGLLHGCGFDDHGEAEYTRMHKTEDAILEAIGVERTFDTNRSRSSDADGGNEIAGERG